MNLESPMGKRFIFLLFSSCLLLLVSISAAAEDSPNPGIVLEELLFESDQRTRPEALVRKVKLEAGMRFQNMEELREKLDLEVQELVNLRFFADVKYRIELLSEREGEPQAIRVVITVKDTWTLFPFIVPQSDGSTSAFVLGVVDKNFLGTLTEFKVSGDFSIGTNPVDGKLEIPQWGVYLDWSGYYVNQWQFSTQTSQTFVTERKFDGDTLIQDYSYFSTLLLFNARYEFRRLPRLYFHMIPMVGWRYNYDARTDDNPIEYEFFRAGLTLALDYKRIDWYEFYRRGWSLGLLNATWGSTDTGNGSIKTIFTLRSSGFATIWGTNPNARLVGLYSLNHEMTNLGRFLRGVRNDNMYGDRGAFFNSGIQIRLWKAKVIEPHLQPFVDFGIASKRNQPPDWEDDFHLGVGSELILFLPQLPSAQIRGWVGFDLSVSQWSKASWEAGLSFQLAY